MASSLRYYDPMFLLMFGAYALVILWIAWRRRQWLLDALMPGVLALLVVGFFWRLVSGDTYMPADGGDLGSFLFPTYAFIQHSLKSGTWPLWNPHIYSGVPFVAEVQSGILYLPHLLRFVLGSDLQYRDMQWLAMAHIWWTGVTTYFLGRGLGLQRLPALFAAIAFMFSDLFIVHFGNLNLIAVTSWLPLALLGVHRTLVTGRWWPAVGAGLLLGLGALAGHVQMTLYSFMAVGLWASLWLILSWGQDDFSWQRPILAILLPVGIALGISTPMLLPGVQVADMSERVTWRYAETVGFSLSPAQLIGLLIPGFFGRGPALHWGLWPRVEVGYLGVVTLLLAAVGVVMRRDRLTWLMIGLATLSLLFSLGIYGALHGWLTWLLPTLAQLRAPARFIFLFDLAIAILAARGLQAMMAPWHEAGKAAFDLAWRPIRSLALIAIAIGIPVTYAVLLLTQMADPTLHLRASVSTIAVIGFILLLGASLILLYARRREWLGGRRFAILVVILLFIDLVSLGAYQDLSEIDPSQNYYRQGILDFLHADNDLFRMDTRTDIDGYWQPDTALLQGLYDTWGVVNPLTLAAYPAYLQATASRSSDLYALLNVKYLLGKKDIALDADTWELVFEGDPDLNVFRNKRYLPRAHLMGQVSTVPDLLAAQQAIRAPDFQPLSQVVLEGGQDQSQAAGSATIAAWGVNELSFRTTATAPNTLLVAQVWYPGWEASIDGGAWQPVLRADGVWQAVQVPAGEHEIRFRFRSRPFVVGLIIAGSTLLLAGLAFGFLWFRRER